MCVFLCKKVGWRLTQKTVDVFWWNILQWVEIAVGTRKMVNCWKNLNHNKDPGTCWSVSPWWRYALYWSHFVILMCVSFVFLSHENKIIWSAVWRDMNIILSLSRKNVWIFVRPISAECLSSERERGGARNNHVIDDVVNSARLLSWLTLLVKSDRRSDTEAGRRQIDSPTPVCAYYQRRKPTRKSGDKRSRWFCQQA